MKRLPLWMDALIVAAAILPFAAAWYFHESRERDLGPVMFSPDSRLVAYPAEKDDGFRAGRWRFEYSRALRLHWRRVDRPDEDRSMTVGPLRRDRRGCFSPDALDVSPDSRYVAMVASKDLWVSDLYVADLEAGRSWKLLEDVGILGAAWCGKGQIAYVSCQERPGPATFYRIGVEPGSKPVEVFRCPSLVMHLMCEGAFSPSGRYVVFGHAEPERQSLLLDLTTGRTVKIADEAPGEVLMLNSWRADETQVVALRRNPSGRDILTLLDIPSGKTTDLSDLWASDRNVAAGWPYPVWADNDHVLVNTVNIDCNGTPPGGVVCLSRREVIPISKRFSALVSLGKPFIANFFLLKASGRMVAPALDNCLWTVDCEGTRAEKLCPVSARISTRGPGDVPSAQVYGRGCAISPDEKWMATWRLKDEAFVLKRVDIARPLAKGTPAR